MNDMIAIFGYGSLVNKDSLEKTLGRPVDRLLPVMVENWVRDWSVVFTDKDGLIRYEPEENHSSYKYIRALNIRRDETAVQPINGALFEVSKHELAALDVREKHYEKVDITADVLTPHPFLVVYTYTGMQQYIDHGDIVAKTPKTYIRVIEEGFHSLGNTELQKFHQTTPIPN